MIATEIPRGVLAVACLCSIVAGHASSAEPPVASSVTVTTVPQRTVVFVDHVGPYWGIADKLEAVRTYKRAQDLSGPLLIRYAADPTRTGGSSIAMKIGLAIDGKHTPSAPFKMETWDAEFVATTRVQARSAGLAVACRTIRLWSKSHGFVPTGPVIELFAESTRSETDRGRATVQMAIRPVRSKPPETDGDSVEQAVVPEPQTQQAGGDARVLPPKSTVSAKTTRIERSPKRLTLDPHAAEKTAKTKIKPLPQEGRARGANAEAGPEESTPAIRPAPSNRDAAKASMDTDTDDAGPKHQEEKGRQEAATKSLARRLVPPSNSLDGRSLAWLGQVVLRLRAISRGTKRLYSEEGAAIIGLSDAVVSRYAQVYGQSILKPKSRPSATGPADSALALRRNAVTRDLDRFMAVLGSKSLSISETEIRFRRIINRAAETADAIVLRRQ